MKRVLPLVIAAILVTGLLVAWTLRFRVADALVARRLAAAGVPARYRLTRIDPFHQRIEQVRIGDPAAPDLVARRLDILIGYGAAGAHVRAIHAEGVRLRARADGTGLHLGALDRLLPRTGTGGAVLPDVALRVRDTVLLLDTPQGRLAARLEGAGNPQARFAGHAEIAAPALRLAACRLAGVRASLRLVARAGRPAADGTLALARATCPTVSLGAGRARVMLAADATVTRLTAHVEPSGFGGSAGPLRFAAVTGAADAAGRFGALAIRAGIGLRSAALPALVRRLRDTRTATAVPFAPLLTRGQEALATLLADADIRIAGRAAIQGRTVRAALQHATLTGPGGARIEATARDGMTWTAQGWRADGTIVAGGGGLPSLGARIHQAAPGAPLTGTARIAPYRAGDAQLAVPTLGFAWAGDRLRFAGRLLADGPIGAGAVRGLDVPVEGWAAASGAFAFGAGCRSIAFQLARIGGFTFERGTVPLCGQPIVARAAGGDLRLDLAVGTTRLDGHSGAAPLSLGIGAAHLAAGRFTVAGIDARLGAGDTPTRLHVATLTGTIGAGMAGGGFTQAGGRIGAVPLLLEQADGQWRFAGGALHLAGGLGVRDTATPPRFRPLAATDATLDLGDGTIRADATLREPTTRAAVARVSLSHDLVAGAGTAHLSVDGIRFAPKALQPDMLTPLTLGVVANVAGTVTGDGRIAWDARGVSSQGSFGTDRLDLAAAFGPVTGIKGRIAFTDLLNLVSAPNQQATIAEINPGVAIANGVVRFALPGNNRVAVAGARWPFAGGTLRLDPALLDFSATAERHLTFRLDALDAAAFVQQLDFPNISATGTFDGVLPMVFTQAGGRIDAGAITARAPGGSIAYVGALTTASLGTMGKLAFDALKAIRYSTLGISLNGRLDGEMVSRVAFTGVREATPDRSLVARMIRNLPFRFTIDIRAPFRGLVGTARSYMEPQLLLQQVTPRPAPVQSPASGSVR